MCGVPSDQEMDRAHSTGTAAPEVRTLHTKHTLAKERRKSDQFTVAVDLSNATRQCRTSDACDQQRRCLTAL